MELHRFEALLRRGAGSLEVGLDEPQILLLHRYFQELLRWSGKVNLISKHASEEEIVDKHFLDSLALLGLLDGRPAPLFDIGSGAGFPGLACKAARPELPVSLVEPRLKRVSFLRHVIRLLGLSGIEVHGCRLEEGREVAGECTAGWVVGRAVTAVGDFLKLCERFRSYGAAVVCMQGPGYHRQFDEAPAAAAGWRLAETRAYRLPLSGAERVLLVFRGVPDGAGTPQSHDGTVGG